MNDEPESHLEVSISEEVEAGPGSFFLAPRGIRHAFRNPGDIPVRVLGLWSPGPAGLAFMEDVAAALPTAGPPDLRW